MAVDQLQLFPEFFRLCGQGLHQPDEPMMVVFRAVDDLESDPEECGVYDLHRETKGLGLAVEIQCKVTSITLGDHHGVREADHGTPKGDVFDLTLVRGSIVDQGAFRLEQHPLETPLVDHCLAPVFLRIEEAPLVRLTAKCTPDSAKFNRIRLP